MVQCAIEGCTSRSDTHPSGFIENAVHFHRIPIATVIRQKWMKAINKREVSNSTRVCSLHFKKENYYLTRRGLNKLIGDSVPELKLPYVEGVKEEDSSSDEEMTNINYQSQCQQTSTKETTPKIGTKVNVLGSSNIKHGEDVNGDSTDSSEDENMSNVQHQEPTISFNNNLPNQCQLNISKEITTDNDKGSSSTIKPGVQKHKVKTLLERTLLKEVRRLQEAGKKRMEAIKCLIDQNRRLLERNSFLEQELENSKKVAQKVNNVSQH